MLDFLAIVLRVMVFFGAVAGALMCAVVPVFTLGAGGAAWANSLGWLVLGLQLLAASAVAGVLLLIEERLERAVKLLSYAEERARPR